MGIYVLGYGRTTMYFLNLYFITTLELNMSNIIYHRITTQYEFVDGITGEKHHICEI